MYWYLFIGILILYLCIEYPIILLGAATIIGINLFLNRGKKKSAETVGSVVVEDAIDEEKDITLDRTENNSEGLPKFAAGFTHRPNTNDPESPEECEFVMKEDDGCEFIKSEEMPSYSHDSGSFHIRM